MLEEFLFFVINNINGTDPSKFLQIGPKFTTIGCKKCLTYSRDNFALGEISGELYGLNSVEKGQYAKCMINNVICLLKRCPIVIILKNQAKSQQFEINY